MGSSHEEQNLVGKDMDLVDKVNTKKKVGDNEDFDRLDCLYEDDAKKH